MSRWQTEDHGQKSGLKWELLESRGPLCTGHLFPHKHESLEPFHSAVMTERGGPVSATRRDWG